MQKIVPHLWFDKEAKQAAEFYTSVFDNSKIISLNTIPDTPSGDAELVAFQVMVSCIRSWYFPPPYGHYCIHARAACSGGKDKGTIRHLSFTGFSH